MYEWCARLGVLVPSGIVAIEPEFNRVIPEAVSAITTEPPLAAVVSVISKERRKAYWRQLSYSGMFTLRQ